MHVYIYTMYCCYCHYRGFSITYFYLGHEPTFPTHREIGDKELFLAADNLPSLIEKGRAASTVKKYKKGWQGWVTWGSGKGLRTRPAEPYCIALYLYHLFLNEVTKATARNLYIKDKKITRRNVSLSLGL